MRFIAVFLLAISLTACGDLLGTTTPTPTARLPEPQMLIATPTPVAPQPSVERIVFSIQDAQGSQIYTSNSDGSGLAQITNDTASNVTPRWSPDRTIIAFASDRDGTSQLYLVQPDGSNVRQLTRDPAGAYAPTWSPDGTRLAFVSGTDDQARLSVLDLSNDVISPLSGVPLGVSTPDWSPDGRRIAFGLRAATSDGESDIFSVRADGTGGLLNLTNRPDADLLPMWSPDSRRIVYQRGAAAQAQIYVMNANGTAQTQLTSEPAGNQQPTWASNGRQIAFVGLREQQRVLLTMNDNGEQIIEIVRSRLTITTPHWQPAPTTDRDEQLVYVDDNGLENGRSILQINSNGTGLTQLVASERGQLSNTTPAWSPSGDLLAYASAPQIGGQHDLLIVNPAQRSEPVNLTVGEGDNLHPAWSPDGQQIAFESNRTGNWDVWVVNRDGTGLRNLTANSLANDGNPAWSPDGGSIAFASNRGGRYHIYRMVSDGSGEPQNLTPNDTSNNFFPDWSPDGTTLVYRASGVQHQIALVPAQGGTSEVVLATNANNDQPVWSPDGSRIAFVSDRNTGDQRIYQLFLFDLRSRTVTRVGSGIGSQLYPHWRSAR
jgi:Tol biopolymer transport system component